MRINRKQLEALDAVALGVFLDRIEVVARDNMPERICGRDELRGLIQSHYREAVSRGLRTERKIADYVLERLKKVEE